jgi:hypothetical protein
LESLIMSEAEVVKDIAAVLATVRQGIEIIVEQNHRPVAVIKPPAPGVEEGIKAHRQPWNPPSRD